jgi:hypothetical protein
VGADEVAGSASTAPTSDPVAPLTAPPTGAAAAPGTAALVVQTATLVEPTRLAVAGTVDCAAGSTYTVSARLTEIGSDTSVVKLSDAVAGPCTGTGPQPWTVTVTGAGGEFVPVITGSVEVVEDASKNKIVVVDQRGLVIGRGTPAPAPSAATAPPLTAAPSAATAPPLTSPPSSTDAPSLTSAPSSAASARTSTRATTSSQPESAESADDEEGG